MIITLILSYAFALLYYFFLGKRPEASWIYILFIVAYMWIPGICAWIMAKKDEIYLPFRCRFSTYLKTGCISLLFALIPIFLGAFLYEWQPIFIENWKSSVLSLFFYFLIGLFLGPLVVLGQEMMWRGVLYEKYKHLGFLKASAWIGLIWGIWYIPLILLGFNHPEHPVEGIFMTILLTVAVSPLFFYLREKGHSVLVPTAFHGVMNAFFGVAFFVFAAPNYLVVGPTGILGIATYALASIYAWKKR